MSDPELRTILEAARTVAVVGLSSKPHRPSYEVASYLQHSGYRIIPVNPHETEVLGQRAFASLLDLPERVDIVDVFRQSEHAPELAGQAVRIGAGALWLQLGIVNEEAGRIADAGGLFVVMDLCIMTTHRRLGVGRTEEKEG